MNLNLSLPLNSVSFGLVSYNILKELYNRGITPNLFLIGQPDLSSFDKMAPDMGMWLQSCINRAPTKYNRDFPCFKLWHINGSENSVSNKNGLMTFLETDSVTPIEKNILQNQSKVFISSNYTKQVFENNGLDNVVYCPLGFDSENFRKVGAHPYDNKSIVFGLMGKFESKRKHTDKVLNLWARKYGKNPKYRLHVHTFNSFFDGDPQKCAQINLNLIAQACGGEIPWNVNIVNGIMKTLTEYNSFVNSIDIMLDGSGNEGWGLPSFHAAGLGKHLVAVNSNAAKDWATEENAVLVDPSGKEDSDDGFFFRKGMPFNQGSFFTFDDNEFVAAMESAGKRYEKNPVNIAGLSLQKQFTWDKTVDIILDNL